VIAAGRQIRNLRLLQKSYGKGRWRKLKGQALVELKDKRLVRTELMGSVSGI